MRRARVLLAALASALLGACGGGAPIPEVDHWIGIEVGAEEVETGVAFPLTVVRVWSEELAPAAWDDRALSPLTLRLQALVRDEDGARVRETRRYRAYAFTLDDVVIPAVPFAARPRSGGEARAVHAAAIRLAVRTSLDPAAPGRPELPGLPLSEPGPVVPWLWVGLALLLGVVVAWQRSRRAPPPEVELAVDEPEPPAPAEIALEAIERVRMCASGDARADVVEISEIVREFVDAQLAVRAPYHSTEEILAAPVIGEGGRRRLGRLLGLSDRAKFAAHQPTATERSDHLEDAEGFVRETARGATS